MSKTKNKTTNNETYNISRGVATITAAKTPGRKPSKLGNTMRILNIGDGFTYPFTSTAAPKNVHRAARTYGFEMTTKRTNKGVFAIRLA